MAYEVTKRIGGRDYRYRVEGYRDPESGKTRTRWQYLGRVVEGGALAPPTRRPERVTRDKIITATAELLQTRDASRVTVLVIARHAGVSEATFYRYFAERKCAFTAALAYLADETAGELPSLDSPLGTRKDEIRRIFNWLDVLQRSLLRQRAFRWSFRSGEGNKLRARVERSLLKRDVELLLLRYLQRLDDAGLARIEDPAALAHSIIRITAALLRFVVNDEVSDDKQGVSLADAFPVIERAIFCASAATRRSAPQPRGENDRSGPA